jgi:hypothetical protein
LLASACFHTSAIETVDGLRATAGNIKQRARERKLSLRPAAAQIAAI